LGWVAARRGRCRGKDENKYDSDMIKERRRKKERILLGSTR
jgi:hypothetical protein